MPNCLSYGLMIADMLNAKFEEVVELMAIDFMTVLPDLESCHEGKR